MKRRLVLLGACAIGVLSLAPTGPLLSHPGQYEVPPSFSASQVLPPELLSSPNYTIGDRVGLENFQYAFTVDTKYGTFVIKGTDLLRVRAREIAALRQAAAADRISCRGSWDRSGDATQSNCATSSFCARTPIRRSRSPCLARSR